MLDNTRVEARPEKAGLSSLEAATVWDRFFCVCCQTERSNADKVRISAHHTRCTFCVAKGNASGFKAKRGRPIKNLRVDDDEPDTSVPDSVMAAYTESVAD